MAAEHPPAKRSHSPPPNLDDGDAKGPGRQRSREACAPCRQRKRKCNGRMPCDTCVRYEYKCEYSAAARAPGPGQHHEDATAAGSSSDRAAAGGSHAHAKEDDVQAAAHPLTAPGARFHHRSMLDSSKTRFVRANSAIAFPRILGMEFESESIPRMHSFAWNLGVRPESVENIKEIPTLLTLADMQHLAAVYFAVVGPEIGMLDEADFLEQVGARFSSPAGYCDLDAVALGVAALGSFFAPTPHVHEVEFLQESRRSMVQHSLNRSPTTNHTAAWLLRTIYLRLTSRPHAAWITSCIAMHQVEACGLHKEMQTIAVVIPAAPQGDTKQARARRRLYWTARSLNTIVSFEFGRSRVVLDQVTTRKSGPEPGSHADQLVELAELLPNEYFAPNEEHEPDPPAALSLALTRLEELRTDSPFLSLLKADMAFSIYRRLWLMSLTDAKDRAETVLAIGLHALTASQRLLDAGRAWWNVVGVPFHFLCVLLAMGTPRSLAAVPEAVGLLRRIALRYDTHMVREAYAQAAALVAMARRRKARELDSLNAVADDPALALPRPNAASSSSYNHHHNNHHQHHAHHPNGSAGHLASSPLDDTPGGGPGSFTDAMSSMSAAPQLDWADDLPFAWDIFLNPELVVSQQQQQQQQQQMGHTPLNLAAYGDQMGFP